MNAAVRLLSMIPEQAQSSVSMPNASERDSRASPSTMLDLLAHAFPALFQAVPPTILIGPGRIGVPVALKPVAEPVEIALVHCQAMAGLDL